MVNMINNIMLTPSTEQFNMELIFLNSLFVENSAENFIRLPVNPKFPIVAKDVTERIKDQSPSFWIPSVAIIYLYKKNEHPATSIV